MKKQQVAQTTKTPNTLAVEKQTTRRRALAAMRDDPLRRPSGDQRHRVPRRTPAPTRPAGSAEPNALGRSARDQPALQRSGWGAVLCPGRSCTACPRDPTVWQPSTPSTLAVCWLSRRQTRPCTSVGCTHARTHRARLCRCRAVGG